MTDPHAAQVIDVSDVHPLRRERMLRRIAAVRRWLAEGAGDRSLEASIADELGMTVAHFRVLVRAWIVHGRAADMPGANFSVPRRRRPSTGRRLEEEKLIDEVIGELGSQSRPIDVMAEVRDRCDAAGLEPPSIDRVSARVYRARGRPQKTRKARRLVVDHCALRMPVIVEDRILVPVATVCFDDAGRIFSWRLAFSGPTPQVTAGTLADGLRAATPSGDPAPLVMGAGRTPGWGRILDELASASVIVEAARGVPVPSGRRMRAAFGPAIGGLRLLPNHTHSSDRTPRLTAGMMADPLDLMRAESAVADAVRSSNAARGGSARRPRIASDADEAALAASLSGMSMEAIETPRRRG